MAVSRFAFAHDVAAVVEKEEKGAPSNAKETVPALALKSLERMKKTYNHSALPSTPCLTALHLLCCFLPIGLFMLHCLPLVLQVSSCCARKFPSAYQVSCEHMGSRDVTAPFWINETLHCLLFVFCVAYTLRRLLCAVMAREHGPPTSLNKPTLQQHALAIAANPAAQCVEDQRRSYALGEHWYTRADLFTNGLGKSALVSLREVYHSMLTDDKLAGFGMLTEDEQADALALRYLFDWLKEQEARPCFGFCAA